jgi:hypothetical protein
MTSPFGILGQDVEIHAEVPGNKGQRQEDRGYHGEEVDHLALSA